MMINVTPITIRHAIEMQTIVPSAQLVFLCSTCRSWLGGCGCKRGMFITCAPCHIPYCWGYEQERRKEDKP